MTHYRADKRLARFPLGVGVGRKANKFVRARWHEINRAAA
jgi:hypothetical protein